MSGDPLQPDSIGQVLEICSSGAAYGSFALLLLSFALGFFKTSRAGLKLVSLRQIKNEDLFLFSEYIY